MTKLSRKTVRKPWEKKNFEKEPDVEDYEPLEKAVDVWANKIEKMSGWYSHSELCEKLSDETTRPFTWRERQKLKKHLKENEYNIVFKSNRPNRKTDTTYYIGQPIKKRVREAKEKVSEEYEDIIEKAFNVGRKPSVCIATIKYLTGNNSLQEMAKKYSVSAAAIRRAKDFVKKSLND